ncbi:MAG: hypothetical protein VX265_14490, partial [Myxococcota bacterium]|nr:hypothetical protein [Myxococcota bacterium]
LQARRDDPLEALVELALARGLAGDIAVYEPSPAEVRERLAALRRTWVDPRAWAAFLERVGHTEEQLAGALYSRMMAERYVARNVTMPARSRADDAADADEAAAIAYGRWAAEQRRRVGVRIIPAIAASAP